MKMWKNRISWQKGYALYFLWEYLRVIEKQLEDDHPEAVERLMHVGWRFWYDLERRGNDE